MKKDKDLFDILINDEIFISWIYQNPNSKCDHWVEKYPHNREIIIKAEKFIRSIQFKKEELSPSKVQSLKNIIEENILIFESSKKSRVIRYFPLVFRAAVIVFFLALLIGLYFILYNTGQTSSNIEATSYVENLHIKAKN